MLSVVHVCGRRVLFNLPKNWIKLIIPRFIKIHRYFFILFGVLIPFRIRGWSNYHFMLSRLSHPLPLPMLDGKRAFEAFDFRWISKTTPLYMNWQWYTCHQSIYLKEYLNFPNLIFNFYTKKMGKVKTIFKLIGN